MLRQQSQATFELMKNRDPLQDVRNIRLRQLALRFGVELKGNVNVVSAAEPWGAFLADFDQIVPTCVEQAHVLSSEIRNTAHLPELSSISLKTLLDLLTTHSGFQFARVFSEHGLVVSFAFRRFAPLSHMLYQP